MLPRALFGAAAAAAAAAAAPAAEWRSVVGAAPWGARGHCGSVVDRDGAMLLTGGMSVSNNSYHNDVWGSTDGGQTWEQRAAAAPWAPRHRHGAALLNGCVHVFGGTAGKIFYADVWKSCDGGRTWEQVAADAGWQPREGFGFAVDGGGTLVMAGGTFGEWGPPTSEVWATKDAVTWELVANNTFSARYAVAASTTKDGEVLIAGGTETGLNDVWATADGGKTWEERTPAAAWAPRLYVGLATLGANTVLIGGQSNKTKLFVPYRDAWTTGDGGRTWQQLPDAPPAMPARGGMGFLPGPSGDSLVVLGGNSELFPHKDFPDVWSLTMA